MGREECWEHALGGVRTLVRDADGLPIAHGGIVQRRVPYTDRSRRAGSTPLARPAPSR